MPHDVRVAEAVDHLMLALHARVRDLADLGAVEVRPPTAVEVATKRNDALWVDEIDESVAHVALIAVIDGQVEKVILALKMCGRSKVLISKPKKKEQ